MIKFDCFSTAPRIGLRRRRSRSGPPIRARREPELIDTLGDPLVRRRAGIPSEVSRTPRAGHAPNAMPSWTTLPHCASWASDSSRPHCSAYSMPPHPWMVSSVPVATASGCNGKEEIVLGETHCADLFTEFPWASSVRSCRTRHRRRREDTQPASTPASDVVFSIRCGPDISARAGSMSLPESAGADELSAGWPSRSLGVWLKHVFADRIDEPPRRRRRF